MRATASPATWQNWARTETAAPAVCVSPRGLDELTATVQAAGRAGQRLRVVGGGHSFTGAAVTDGVLLRLDQLATVERVQPGTGPGGTTLVTVGAGIRLRELNLALAERGLALPNLGDIDHQSLAGAISTGTHGTGARLRGLAGQVAGLRVVTAAGDVLDCSPTQHAEVFEAARLGLGSVGVLAAVTLATVPAFSLDAREEPWPLERVLEELPGPDGLVESNDHFEFYWFPHTRRTLTKRNNRLATVGPPLGRARRWFDDELLANGVFEALNRFTTLAPRTSGAVNELAARAVSARHYGAPSYDVFVSPRRVRFREMEWAVPRAAVAQVLTELDAWIAASGEHVSFPVEVRFAAADDVWLSTAYQRDSAYVAVHAYARRPYLRYFTAAERIAAAAGGRPHWGKIHWLDAERLAALYPRFEDFRAVRATQDPGGMFANEYTDRVFGRVRT